MKEEVMELRQQCSQDIKLSMESKSTQATCEMQTIETQTEEEPRTAEDCQTDTEDLMPAKIT